MTVVGTPFLKEVITSFDDDLKRSNSFCPPSNSLSSLMSTAASEDRQAIFLANESSSNVRGRADRGSTWLAIPSRTDRDRVTIKHEHNATFTVIVLYKEVVSTR